MDRKYKWIFGLLLTAGVSLAVLSGCDVSTHRTDAEKKNALIKADVDAQKVKSAMQESEEYARELEKQKKTLEGELQNVVAMLGLRESRIKSLEQMLAQREAQVNTAYDELAKREVALRQKEQLSWIILGVGLFAAALGFIVSGRNLRRRKGPEASGSPAQEAESDIRVEESEAPAEAQGEFYETVAGAEPSGAENGAAGEAPVIDTADAQGAGEGRPETTASPPSEEAADNTAQAGSNEGIKDTAESSDTNPENKADSDARAESESSNGTGDETEEETSAETGEELDLKDKP